MHKYAHRLILASSSQYRKVQLEKLGIEFSTVSPSIDEARQNSESPEALVQRLSLEKATAVKTLHPDCIVIGSDQVAYIKKDDNKLGLANVHVLSKPHSSENAIKQLDACSGKCVRFVTGLCCLAPGHDTQLIYEYVDVTFRHLCQREIENYVAIEQPLDCAGSFKVEGLGISLFEKVESSDPNTLIGLPIIALNRMLLNIGLNILL